MEPITDKQTEKLAKEILDEFTRFYSEVDKERLAKMILDAGYRKHRRGRWIDKIGDFECSECHIPNEYIENYCPYCGAKMKD